MTSAEYKKKYEKLSAKAGQYDVNEFTNELERQLQENVNYNKDLYDQENALRQEQLGTGARLRDEYYNSPIRNALTQENLIAQARANTGTRLGTVTDLLGERKARFNDIVAKAASAYQSAGERARLQAEEMWRMFTNQQGLEEAARNRGGGGGANISPFDVNGNGVPDYLEGKDTKDEKAIEVDDRSLGTKAVDAYRKLGYGTMSALDMVGIDPMSIGKKMLNTKMGKSFLDAYTKFLSSGMGQSYLKQSNNPKLAQSFLSKYGLRSQ